MQKTQEIGQAPVIHDPLEPGTTGVGTPTALPDDDDFWAEHTPLPARAAATTTPPPAAAPASVEATTARLASLNASIAVAAARAEAASLKGPAAPAAVGYGAWRSGGALRATRFPWREKQLQALATLKEEGGSQSGEHAADVEGAPTLKDVAEDRVLQHRITYGVTP